MAIFFSNSSSFNTLSSLREVKIKKNQKVSSINWDLQTLAFDDTNNFVNKMQKMGVLPTQAEVNTVRGTEDWKPISISHNIAVKDVKSKAVAIISNVEKKATLHSVQTRGISPLCAETTSITTITLDVVTNHLPVAERRKMRKSIIRVKKASKAKKHAQRVIQEVQRNCTPQTITITQLKTVDKCKEDIKNRVQQIEEIQSSILDTPAKGFGKEDMELQTVIPAGWHVAVRITNPAGLKVWKVIQNTGDKTITVESYLHNKMKYTGKYFIGARAKDAHVALAHACVNLAYTAMLITEQKEISQERLLFAHYLVDKMIAKWEIGESVNFTEMMLNNGINVVDCKSSWKELDEPIVFSGRAPIKNVERKHYILDQMGRLMTNVMNNLINSPLELIPAATANASIISAKVDPTMSDEALEKYAQNIVYTKMSKLYKQKVCIPLTQVKITPTSEDYSCFISKKRLEESGFLDTPAGMGFTSQSLLGFTFFVPDNKEEWIASHVKESIRDIAIALDMTAEYQRLTQENLLAESEEISKARIKAELEEKEYDYKQFYAMGLRTTMQIFTEYYKAYFNTALVHYIGVCTRDQRGRMIPAVLKMPVNIFATKALRARMRLCEPLILTEDGINALLEHAYEIGKKEFLDTHLKRQEYGKAILEGKIPHDHLEGWELEHMELLIQEWKNHLEGKGVSILVEYDQTASGPCYIACLTGDRKVLEATNAIGNKDGVLIDPYYETFTTSEGQEVTIARVFMKRPILVIQYGSFKTVTKVLSTDKESKDKFLALTAKEQDEIQHHIADMIENTDGKYHILRKFANVLSNVTVKSPVFTIAFDENSHCVIQGNKPIRDEEEYKTTGKEIDYVQAINKVRIVFTKLSKGVATAYYSDEVKEERVVNQDRMKSYMASCRIHNLDSRTADIISWIMINVYDMFVITNHDAFFTHPNFVSTLKKIAQMVLYWIYKDGERLLTIFFESVGIPTKDSKNSLMTLLSDRDENITFEEFMAGCIFK